MLKYNEDTKVIFDNPDDPQGNIRSISKDEVSDLIANGATVDSSAQGSVPDEHKDDAYPFPKGDEQNQSGNVTANVPQNDVPVSVQSEQDRTKPNATVEGQQTIAAGDRQNADVGGAVAQSQTEQQKEEQRVADEGVDTTKNQENVTVTTDKVGAVGNVAMTPGGVPVVDAQPEAVTVKGPEFPVNSPAATAAEATNAAHPSNNPNYADKDHSGMIDQLLDDLQGIEAMGKSEIKYIVDSLRSAFHRKD